MNREYLVAVSVAVLGATLIGIGIFQELLHVAPAYEGTIDTGWGGPINHEEYLLAQLAAVGVVGALISGRWRGCSLVPIATGGVVLFYVVRAILYHALDPGLYTEVTHGQTTTRLVLGAEPFLLIAGGILLVGAGGIGWRMHSTSSATTGSPPSVRLTDK